MTTRDHASNLDASASFGAANAAAARSVALHDRANELARAQQADRPSDELDFLVFQLAWESYAIEARFVREIFPLRDLVPIPCTPDFLMGIINLRGELCPVIDLKRLIGLPEQGLTNATSVVILHDETMEFGIVADVVAGVRPLGLADIQDPPVTLVGVNASFLRGVTKDQTIVLDAANILAYPGIVVNQQIEG